MHILLSAYACAPNRGSEPGIGWNWAVSLAHQGVKVYCFTGQRNREAIINFTKKQPIDNVEFVFVKVWKWLEFLRKKVPFPFWYLHYLVWQYQAYHCATKMQYRVKFDIVHHVSYGSIQLGSHMWKLGVPFIFGPIGGGEKIPVLLKRYVGIGWFRELFRSIAEYLLLHRVKNTRQCLQKASVVLVTSEETFNWAKRYGAKDVRYFLDMGIRQLQPHVSEQSTFTKDRINFLWVGKLITKKGLGLVLDGLEEANNNRIYLTVVGDGPLLPYYQWRVRRLGLSEQVRFVGYQSYEQLKEQYASHHALLYTPLRSAFGGQLLEATSFGLPVITLDIHGANRFISYEIGFKLIPKGKQVVGETINHIYEHPNEYENMRENAYQFAAQHTWQKKATKILQIYHEMQSTPPLYSTKHTRESTSSTAE